VVFISCVGAHQVKEQLPDANVTMCFQDIRAFGKGFEEFYGQVKTEGVFYLRGLPGKIYKKPGSDRVVV
jgi:heterodisulfide reductase subunit A